MFKTFKKNVLLWLKSYKGRIFFFLFLKYRHILMFGTSQSLWKTEGMHNFKYVAANSVDEY